MGSWSNYIKRITTQTAVYWGNPQNDGDGGKTFDAPVEIPCRWERMVELKQMKGYDEKVGANSTNTKIITRGPLVVNGFLYLGPLSDLPASPNDPGTIDEAYKILLDVSVPIMSGREMQYEYII